MRYSPIPSSAFYVVYLVAIKLFCFTALLRSLFNTLPSNASKLFCLFTAQLNVLCVELAEYTKQPYLLATNS
jgi:hypothetical protein